MAVDATTGGVSIRSTEDTLELDCTLAELEERLDPADFVRLHRSHVVNLAHVRSVSRYDERRLEVRLSDGSAVVASRQGSQALRKVMKS